MKYRLIWQKNTPLDLSQILDDRGRPIVFIGKGAQVTVDAITYKHPLIQKYCGNGLDINIIDPIPLQDISRIDSPTATPPSLTTPTAELARIIYKKRNAPYLKDESVKDESIKDTSDNTIAPKKYRSKRIKTHS